MSRVREALERLDLRCANYVEKHRPGYDLCAKNRRPRGGPYGADQWCLECEVRDALLLADTPSVEPPCEHEWEDGPDDETAWYCPKCGVTEHPGEGVHEDDVLAWREACEAFEREMWPNGPASGSGSGVWAAHKDRLFRAAR